MSEALKALAHPGSFTWRTHTYEVSPVTLKIEGLFALGCERRVAEGLRRNRHVLGEDAYRDAVRQFNDDLAACEFEWGGRAATAALKTGGGLRELAFLCLAELQPFERTQMDALYREQETDADGLTHFNRLIATLNELQAPHPNG